MRGLVAIDLPPGQDFVRALVEAWDRGDAVLPVDSRLPPPGRAQLLEAMAPTDLVGPDGERRRLAGGRPAEPGDALVMPTSGTTGEPKGAVLTHAAVGASASACHARLGVDPGVHRWLCCLPLSHVGGMAVVARAVLAGTGLVVLPAFDAGAVLGAGGPEVLVSLVPTTLARVGAEHFRTVLLGGSAPPEVLSPNVVVTYGLTETGSGVVYDGVPLEGVEVSVRPGDGVISVRGPMLARGYRDGSPLPGRDGWLDTGDSGRVDAAGRLHVVGRLSDLIVTGGENVWPVPVEQVLSSHPDVLDVAVGGRPDPEWGERVVAWVVPADRQRPPTLQVLRDWVKATLAPYAAPRQLVLMDALPRTNLGKLRRYALRAPGE